MRILIAPFVLLALSACSAVKTVESAAPAVTATPITQAVQIVKDMPPEEKWRLTCLAADGLYIGYVSMVAPKVSDGTNLKVQAGYEGIKVICANKPTDYASAVVALVQAFSAFKAAMPAKVAG